MNITRFATTLAATALAVATLPTAAIASTAVAGAPVSGDRSAVTVIEVLGFGGASNIEGPNFGCSA